MFLTQICPSFNSMSTVCIGFAVAAFAVCGHPTATNGGETGESIVIEQCFLLVKDKVAVPARERDVIHSLKVDAGDWVREGDVLGKLDDTEAAMLVSIAQQEMSVARARYEKSQAVPLAKAKLVEASKRIDETNEEKLIADKVASSDVAVRAARVTSELSVDELNRNIAARKQFAGSVSELQLRQLETTAKKDRLQVDSELFDLAVEQLRADQYGSTIARLQAAQHVAEVEVEDAIGQRQVNELEVRVKASEVDLAEESLRRREITSPVTGIVVERAKHAGEWVEEGETIVSILRLDKLLVEGYAQLGTVRLTDIGRKARVEISGETTPVVGRIAFVDPQVDAVNRQVLIRVELDNTELEYLPGQTARIVISAKREE